MKTIVAGTRVLLDSNVYTGGGTDITEELQQLLDEALDGGLHLVMDGAALIHGLTIHSNTVIECVDSDCGFYMADHADRPMFTNANWDLKICRSNDIAFIGGTYNHNCTKQQHDVPCEEFPMPDGVNPYNSHPVYLMEFYGVRNMKISGATFLNQRTYALTIGCFYNVLIENTNLAGAEHVHPSNQDGLHFFGPGRFLTLRNVFGTTNDDFINVAPDEYDGVSDITDVLLDGIYFKDTCQGIRMLSHGTGLLDRVTVRNVTGSFRTFGFSINPFFHGTTFGKYGDLYFENIDLRQIEATYNYTPLTFFQAGGDMHCITLKNVRFHTPVRNSLVFDIGRPFFYRPSTDLGGEITYDTTYFDWDWMPETARPTIDTFVLDGVTVTSDDKMDDTNIVELRYQINNAVIKNVQVFRTGEAKTSGKLISLKKEAAIKNLLIEDIYAEKMQHVLCGSENNAVDFLRMNNVTLRDGVALTDLPDNVVRVKQTASTEEI